MGKIGFTPFQKQIFDAFAKEPIARNFYFTGGTALSVFHLKHRESEDLDFFSEKDFVNEPVIAFIEQFTRRLKISYKFTRRGNVRMFFLEKGKEKLKVDFNYYPYPRIAKGTEVGQLSIDSLHDIATNKLLTINQRQDVKDFVDLYFLLKKFTLWDLLYGVEAKFNMKLDQLMVASDFLKIEEFDFLPKMLVPLDTKTLQEFFKNQAIEIGKRVTK